MYHKEVRVRSAPFGFLTGTTETLMAPQHR